ncbi:TTLL3B [Symbiodinium sp. CCMP2456]|nr:TTLL3B [Symbiodinium sp. CCMP2456]
MALAAQDVLQRCAQSFNDTSSCLKASPTSPGHTSRSRTQHGTAEESGEESPARPRSAKSWRREELQCLEMVLRRSCRKEDRLAAYLRRAHNVNGKKERLFCFDGPDEHIRRVLLALDPPWVENKVASSSMWHLKWTVTDSETDYRCIQEDSSSLYNHFQNNRELTTKVCLTRNLRRLAYEEQVDIDTFFPRSYDMGSPSEVEDLILDFRRSAALNVLRQHLRLAEQAADRRRRYELEPFFNAPGYLCNITVLRHAVRALEHWLDDLDGSYFEDDQYDLGRRQLYSEEWDAVVLYSELSEAQLCQLDEAEERKERSRGYSASGALAHRKPGERYARPKEPQKWPELRSHVWCPFAPAELDASAKKAVALLEARWPQVSTQGCMNVWVVKPGTSSKGSGVVCLNTLPELLHHCKNTTNRVVQKYVEKPLLLFSGRKFDLRQWVLVRSFQPLEVYMFSSCYLRLCNEPYDLGDLANRQRHISNWSVNKHGKHVATGAVASLSELNDVLEMMTGSRHYWENDLVPQLKECILHSLRSVQDRVVQRSSCFEVYGFDFLLGEDLKPWLLEVNLSPACESRTPWISELLDRMATRLLELVLNGHLEPDGLAPDWVCIADETPEPGTGQPVDERPLDLPDGDARGRDFLADSLGRCALGLTVVGKALNLRAERRFGEAWRQSAAQVTIARFVRGFLVRHRGEIIARQNAARILQRRVREWQRRRALEMHFKIAASRLWQARMRSYLCSMLLNEIKRRERARIMKARRREAAKRLQCCWRGLLGRRAARAQQMLLAARRLQRCWRGWRLRRRLSAVKRLAHWWRELLAVRASAVLRLQAWRRGQIARTRARQLRRTVLLPATRLLFALSLARWRRFLFLQSGHLAARRVQQHWRGLQGRCVAKERRMKLRMLQCWRRWWQQRTAASLVLQTAFRARCAWRARKLRRVALLRMQATLRCFLERQRLSCLQRIAAAIALQTGFRRWRCEVEYRLARQSILVVQNFFRGWISRRAARRRAARERECWLAAAKVLRELEAAGIGQDADTDATATDGTATVTSSRSSCEERSRQSSSRGVNNSSTDQQSETDSSACGVEEPVCQDSHAASKNREAERDILPEVELVNEEIAIQHQPSMVRLRRPLPIPIAFQACPDKEPLFATPVLPAEIAKPSEGPLNFSDVTLEPRGSDVDRPSGEAALVALLELQRAACDWGLPEAAKAARDAAVTVASPAASAHRQLPDLHVDSRKLPDPPAPSTGSALHAARQLRISQQGAGYRQPTASSEARWSERKAVVAALKEVAKGEPLPASSPTARLNIAYLGDRQAKCQRLRDRLCRDRWFNL